VHGGGSERELARARVERESLEVAAEEEGELVVPAGVRVEVRVRIGVRVRVGVRVRAGVGVRAGVRVRAGVSGRKKRVSWSYLRVSVEV